ncbi:MAG: polyprenyl synthetase family protein [Saprospiraceae bacterium]|nr:polyprenyl synthetase family protein [Saprospiraceae bacterium]
MAFEQREDVSLEEYIEMIRLKTAVLIGCAMKIGAILGNTETEFQNQIYSIGETLGITFQIQDDWLDSWRYFISGKNANGDIIQRKKQPYSYLHYKKVTPCKKKNYYIFMTKKIIAMIEPNLRCHSSLILK